jgi:trimeric autotransporter adhesin
MPNGAWASRFGVPPLGGFRAAPPNAGTPNRISKRVLRGIRSWLDIVFSWEPNVGFVLRRAFASAAALGFLGAADVQGRDATGAIVGWGDNSYHQTNAPANLTNAVALAGGYYHGLALRTDKTVTAWGDNTYNQTNVPASAAGAQAIAAGLYHSLALKDGGVVGWGRNDSHQTTVPSRATNITAIAAGYYFSLALRGDGTALAWGDNSYGQTNLPASLTNVVGIAAGALHGLALRADGTVVAWGAGTNSSGISQNYGQSVVPAGLSNVVALAGGCYHSLALRADGTVVAWGGSTNRLGVAPNFGEAIVPAGLSNVVSVTAGMQHSVALRADGSLAAWGAGATNTGSDPNYGQSIVPPALTNVATVAAGVNFNLALVATAPLLWPTPKAMTIVARGDTTTLSIGVRQRGPFTCQWFFNGSPTPGATATNLQVTNFDLSKAGIYSVTVSNSFGSAGATTVLRLTNSPVVLLDGVDVGGGKAVRADLCQVVFTNTSTTAGDIYYTLDGTTPSFTASPYVAPFAMTNSATVRAVAYNATYTDSAESAPIQVQVWPTYPLTATTFGGGSGSVSPAAYTGGNRYLSNTVVTLTATPANGFAFLNWTGDSTDTTNVTTVLMNGPRNVQAVFGASLTLFTNGNGQMSLDPPTGPYPYGSTVRVTALPAAGSYFFGWAGGASGFANPLSLTITNPLALTALFAPLNANQVTLTTSVSGAGNVVVTPSKNVYANGDSVSLLAVPATNFIFSVWSGDASGTQNPLVLVLNSNKQVTAAFVLGSRTNPPVITQAPLSRTLSPGAATTFSCQLTGDGPFAYQWRLNGSPITGATQPTLFLASATTAQVGLYDVTVTGAAGVATSPAATLALLGLQTAQGSGQSFPLLILDGAPGTSYYLEAAWKLPATNWTLLSPITLQNSQWFYVDEPMLNHTQRFYRAVPR